LRRGRLINAVYVGVAWLIRGYYMRHVTDERTLRVLGEMIAENLAKAQEAELFATHEARSFQRSAQTNSLVTDRQRR
jgi:hypothetical protein